MTAMLEQLLEGHFINGLKLEMRAEVRLMKPTGLGRVMEVAQRVEDRNKHLRPNRAHKASVGTWPRGSQFGQTQTMKGVPINHVRNIPLIERSAGKGASSLRNLTDVKLQEKHDKDLCYWCDRKYTFGHHCPKPELQVLVVKREEPADKPEDEEGDNVGRRKSGSNCP